MDYQKINISCSEQTAEFLPFVMETLPFEVWEESEGGVCDMNAPYFEADMAGAAEADAASLTAAASPAAGLTAVWGVAAGAAAFS